MKIKYTGSQKEITIRGVTFAGKKPVEVDDPSLIEKLLAMPDFEEARAKNKS